jgi:hypothetical protein
MKVIQVKCPGCGNPIQMKRVDRLFLCDKCGTMHVRDGGIERLDYEIAEFSRGAQGEKVYMPFWRVYASFVIRLKKVEGGKVFRLSQWIKGNSEGGDLFVYVPAAELDIGSFKRLAVDMTVATPRYATRLDFGGVERLPAAITKEEAIEMADFVVVTMEAEEPGVLQNLDYSLTIKDAKVVCLPFVRTASGLVPAYE